MANLDSTSLSIETARNILEQFTCLEIQSQNGLKDLDKTRQALLLFVHRSEDQMIGICADSITEAFAALADYLTAFGYEIDLNPNAVDSVDSIEAGVYLKFNTRNNFYYASAYREQYRGVLVCCQSSDEEDINGTYGHFPLDLFH